tara:strand:- start:57 stop:869 length:813 start_codon:yes stop_codon:yes gene_type:complete
MSEEATQEIGSPEVATENATPINFLDSLPEDIRAEPSLKNFSDIGGLAKSYVHAQRLIGADKVPIPGKSATDEDWNLIYSKLGRPDDSNGYEIKMPEAYEDAEASAFKEAAFAAGLNAKQASVMSEMLDKQFSGRAESYNSNAEELKHQGKLELMQEYGAAFDQNMKAAYHAAQHFADPEMLEIELADGRQLGDLPEVVKMFASLANEIKEDNLEGTAQSGVMTPVEANREIAELMAHGSPYWDKMHPQHDYHVNRVLELNEMLVPQPVE